MTKTPELLPGRFGSTTLAADQCRDERGTAVIDNTIRDLQYAVRSFVKAPLTAFTIVMTVAVGLGVVAVLFTVLNALLFRVDNVPDISQMYQVQRPPRANGDPSPLTRPVFDAMRCDRGPASSPTRTQPSTTSICASMAG